MRNAITFVPAMIQTQSRESVTIQVTPDITAKAASIAAKARNKTTVGVLEDWVIEKASEFEMPADESTPTQG